MTIQEINKFLKSDVAVEIKDSQFTLKFPISNFENSYNISTLYRYVKDQVKKWSEYDALPPEFIKK